MTRTLGHVAIAGFLGTVGFLTLGALFSGADWADAARLWNAGGTCEATNLGEKQVTLPFEAIDSLAIDLPASVVHYQPGEKAQAIISGDPELIGHVRIADGRLELDCSPGWFATRLDVRLSGPAITSWDLLGEGALTLAQLDQPRLALSIKGSGNSSAAGTVDMVNLNISGAGAVQFKDLTAKSVLVDIRGSGDAKVTAQVDADVSIYGTGNVELFGNPVLRRSDIRGSGRIVRMP
jgi:hypothetical protein